MQKATQRKERAYKAAMMLKYWKATREPIMDLCMVIAMYTKDVEAGLLYAVGYKASLIKNRHGRFKTINTLSCISLQNKNGEEVFVKGVMNGSNQFHAFLFENGRARVIKEDGSIFDISLESEIIAMNSGNKCHSLFIIDAKMRAYEVRDGTPIRVTGLLDGLKIKDISCGDKFTVFLSERGRVFGMGLNGSGRLGLARRIQKTETPTEISFPNQSDSDKNGIVITRMHASGNGWVAVDSQQRAWIVGNKLMKSVRSDCGSLDPRISIVELWHSSGIQIMQIKCGLQHVIALDIEGRVYWFGRFDYITLLSRVSLDPIPFSHRITKIRSNYDSVACKDATNEWYIWGRNSYNHIKGLCGCNAICKETGGFEIVLNPMRCEWQGLFDASRVIDLQLGYMEANIIVSLV